MKILFVGVFDNNRRSTNTSQLLSFKRLGHEVVGYNYRQRAGCWADEREICTCTTPLEKATLI